MSEMSLLWETTSGVGDGVAPYTQAQANEFFRDFTIDALATMGVLSGKDNELAVSGAASPLSVATGKAIVYGFRYWNDAALNVAVPTPVVGDTGGRIVLRADWGANTVRAAVKLSADGNPAIPALTQVAGTTWEISLCSFVIATTGIIYTTSAKTTTGVTDTRSFALSPLASMVRLRQSAGTGASGVIDWTAIQSDLRHLLIIGHCRSTGAGAVNNLELTLNGVGGTNYDRSQIFGNNGTVAHSLSTGAASWTIGGITAAGGIATAYDRFEIDLPNYANAAIQKTMQARMTTLADRAAANVGSYIQDGWWRQTAAINRVRLAITPAGNFTTDSIFTLYGIR
jgi:hypothetical protein